MEALAVCLPATYLVGGEGKGAALGRRSGSKGRRNWKEDVERREEDGQRGMRRRLTGTVVD